MMAASACNTWDALMPVSSLVHGCLTLCLSLLNSDMRCARVTSRSVIHVCASQTPHHYLGPAHPCNLRCVLDSSIHLHTFLQFETFRYYCKSSMQKEADVAAAKAAKKEQQKEQDSLAARKAQVENDSRSHSTRREELRKQIDRFSAQLAELECAPFLSS